MQRKMHILRIHSCNKTAHSLSHHKHIGGLDRYDHIIELMMYTYTKKLHGTLHHTGRGIAIPAHDSVGKRPMVNSDAQSSVMLFTKVKKRDKSILNLYELFGIFPVSELYLLECTSRINEIAWIDTYFLNPLRSSKSRTRVEMHISDQRHLNTHRAKRLLYLVKVLCLTDTLCSEADYLASGLYNASCLLSRAFSIIGGGSCH